MKKIIKVLLYPITIIGIGLASLLEIAIMLQERIEEKINEAGEEAYNEICEEMERAFEKLENHLEKRNEKAEMLLNPYPENDKEKLE